MTKKVAWNVRQQLSTRWHVPLTFKTCSWIFPNRSLTFVQILRTTFGSETAMSAITPFHAWISSSSKIFKYSIITHLLLFISKQISLSLSLFAIPIFHLLLPVLHTCIVWSNGSVTLSCVHRSSQIPKPIITEYYLLKKLMEYLGKDQDSLDCGGWCCQEKKRLW